MWSWARKNRPGRFFFPFPELETAYFVDLTDGGFRMEVG